jgi:hypothetical protein
MTLLGGVSFTGRGIHVELRVVQRGISLVATPVELRVV